MLPASGTPGTNEGARIPVKPSATIATTSVPWSASTGRTALGRRSSGMAESASTAPPTGRVSAPEKATSPLSPTRKPGVVRPWIDSRAAIDEKAVPISTARPSPRRAPASVSTSAAAAAKPALIAIGRKWMAPGICTSVSPKKCTTAAGTTAQPASRPRRDTVR